MTRKAIVTIAAALLGVSTLALGPAVAGPNLSIRTIIRTPVPPPPPGPCIQCGRTTLNAGSLVVNPAASKVITGKQFVR